MNKRKLHHFYKKLDKIKSWHLLAIALLFLAVGIYGLRQNSFETARLREAVVKADEQDGDVEKALRDLRVHVHSHMNTNLSSGNAAIKPPIQLKNRYERLAQAQAERSKTKTAELQKQAEARCAQQHPGNGSNSPRVACIADYMAANASSAEIPSELYKFDFVSPAWTPDLAGLSLLAALTFFMAFILRAVVEWWYKYEQI